MEDESALATGRSDTSSFFSVCNLKDALQIMSTKSLEFKITALAEKETWMFWTLKSLKSYEESNRVPRGLRNFKMLSQYTEDVGFMAKWTQLHMDYSPNMLKLVRERNEEEYGIIAGKLCKAKTELRTRLQDTNYQAFLKKLEKKLTVL